MLTPFQGFEFNGLHSARDMGFDFAEKDGRGILSPLVYHEYSIAGQGGSVIFDSYTKDALPFEGSLYPQREPRDDIEASRMLRRLGEWLDARDAETPGRARLIWDYEPDRYYMAQITKLANFSIKTWFGGEIPIKITAQPYARSVRPSVATLDTTATSNRVPIRVDTYYRAPYVVSVTNTGTAKITRVRVGTVVDVSGIELAAGQTLTISGETPIGVDINGTLIMDKVAAFTQLDIGSGYHKPVVMLTYAATGTKGARIVVSARGVW